MRAAALLMTLALLLAPHVAHAADDGDWPSEQAPDPVDPVDPPVFEEPPPVPEVTAPSDPGDAAPSFEVPAGLYYVTEVYVADVVTTSGPLTTYGTTTADESPGTYARVLDSVGTGGASVYDGSAFNGRATLTDGQSIAGTYYETFVLTASGFASVSIVFFQDDSELAAATTTTPTPPPAIVVQPSVPSTVAPSTVPPAPALTPAAGAPAATAPAVAAPADEDRAVGVPGTGVTPGSVVTPGTAVGAPPPPVSLRVGVSPDAQGDALSRIEILRGRRVSLWPRATADGVPLRVVAWRFVAGELVALGPLTGGGDDPLVGRWDALAPPGSSWSLRLSLVVDVPGEGPRAVDASVEVVVRAPALIE